MCPDAKISLSLPLVKWIIHKTRDGAFFLANVQRGNELRTLHFLILPFRASELQRKPANSLGKMVILWFLRRVVTDA